MEDEMTDPTMDTKSSSSRGEENWGGCSDEVRRKNREEGKNAVIKLLPVSESPPADREADRQRAGVYCRVVGTREPDARQG